MRFGSHAEVFTDHDAALLARVPDTIPVALEGDTALITAHAARVVPLNASCAAFTTPYKAACMACVSLLLSR